MIKRISILGIAAFTQHVYAGFGGMGNVESDGGDLGGSEVILVLIALGAAYGIMKNTNVGQQIEMFCGTFWGMVVLSIASIFGLGILLRLFFM